MLEAILRSDGEIDWAGRKTHVRPFLDLYGKLTTREGVVWLRVRDSSGGYWSNPGSGCRAGLRFVSKPLGAYRPEAPDELMEIILNESEVNRRKIRFVQRTAVFNLPPATAGAHMPWCYLGEVWRTEVGWTATVVSMKGTSPKCR